MSLDRMDPDERGACVVCGRPWTTSIANVDTGTVGYYCTDHTPDWHTDEEGYIHMNTPRESVSPETVSDQEAIDALGNIFGATKSIGEAIGAMIEAAFAPLRPRHPVAVFTGINGLTGRPFWHITPEGEETISVQGQRGERCTECGHVTLEDGAAGCCQHVEPIDVVACPGCDILYAAYDFTPHVLDCFGGRV